MSGLVKALAVLTGVAILAGIAHANVMATGGYGQPGTILALAIPAAVGVMSVSLGFAVGEQRYALATFSLIFLVAGEIATFAATADRLTTARERQQQPINDAAAKHAAAKARLAAAESSNVVSQAEAAKAKIDADAITASAAPSCKQVCRETLAATAASAQRAVDEAKANATRELAEARAQLEATPMPGPVSPLAARLGWPVWVLDLTEAGLASLASSGLAACLLCFGAHGARQRKLGTAPVKSSTEQTPAGNVHDCVVECVKASEGTEVTFRDLYLSYAYWCSANGTLALTPPDFGERMAQLCDGTDVKSKQRGKTLFLTNIKIITPASTVRLARRHSYQANSVLPVLQIEPRHH